MPLCKKKDKNGPMQKVLIPKGMINPGETTIIEIPARLHKQPLVIAKRKASDPNQPFTSDPVNNSMKWENYEPFPMCQQPRTSYNYQEPVIQKRVQPQVAYASSPASTCPSSNCPSPVLKQQRPKSPKTSWCIKRSPEPSYQNVSRPPQPIAQHQLQYTRQYAYQQQSIPPGGKSRSGKVDMDLDRTEQEEKLALQRNLEEFQRARRKLLTSASYLVSQSQVDRNIQYNRTY